VDPVPDPLLIKSGSAGNRTQDLWIFSQKLDHRGGLVFKTPFLKSQSLHIGRIITALFKKMPVHVQYKISLLKISIISLTLYALPLSTVTPITHSSPRNFSPTSLPKTYIFTRERIHLDIFAPGPV
jgi:hypothetical protein